MNKPVTVRELRRWLESQSGDTLVLFFTHDGRLLELCEAWPTDIGYRLSLEESSCANS